MFAASRQWVVSHENSFIIPAVGVLAALLWWWVFVIDRAPPFEYINTTISPSPAVAGQSVAVRRYLDWHRQCEGDVWREVVGPDKIVRAYDKTYTRVPSLGHQVIESQFILPMAIPDGKAIYRGRVVFRSCGLTSRLMPIEVSFQEVAFDVAHR